MKRFFVRPIVDVMGGLEQLADTKRPGPLMIGMLAVGAATWFVYVPIHELLHAAGCVLTGGTINQLEIQPRYGGTLLAKVFPWVVDNSDYAGRLTGFDTKGSDLIYLATDFAPFLLSVVLGVPLVKMCKRRRRPILFPIAIVLGFAPFYNLTGDYFEMGSIMSTRAATWITGPRAAAPPPEAYEGPEPILVGGETDAAYAGLRADDIFRLGNDLIARPAMLGIVGWKNAVAAVVIYLLSGVVAVVLAFGTYDGGHLLARAVFGRTPAAHPVQ